MTPRTHPDPAPTLRERVLRPWRSIEPAVFVPASVIIVGLIAFAVIYSASAADAFGKLNRVITDGVGWWYVLVATGFVVFAVYCGVSRVGHHPLGT